MSVRHSPRVDVSTSEEGVDVLSLTPMESAGKGISKRTRIFQPGRAATAIRNAVNGNIMQMQNMKSSPVISIVVALATFLVLALLLRSDSHGAL